MYAIRSLIGAFAGLSWGGSQGVTPKGAELVYFQSWNFRPTLVRRVKVRTSSFVQALRRKVAERRDYFTNAKGLSPTEIFDLRVVPASTSYATRNESLTIRISFSFSHPTKVVLGK
jgi:hypothetical protein